MGRMKIIYDLSCSALGTTCSPTSNLNSATAVSGAAGCRSLQRTSLRSTFCIHFKRQRNVLCVINSVIHPFVVGGFNVSYWIALRGFRFTGVQNSHLAVSGDNQRILFFCFYICIHVTVTGWERWCCSGLGHSRTSKQHIYNIHFFSVLFFPSLQHYCLTSPVAAERAPTPCRCTAFSAIVHNLLIYFERLAGNSMIFFSLLCIADLFQDASPHWAAASKISQRSHGSLLTSSRS